MTTVFNAPPDPYDYDRIAQVLVQTSDESRLKKLVLCACRNQWESDTVKLAELNLASLLRELQTKNKTLKELSLSLDRVIRGLSKPAPYMLLTDTLVRELRVCYPDKPPSLDNLYEKVANDLRQNKNLLRIKKLLYCAVTDQWESDQNKLESLDLLALLQEVQLLLPSLEALQQSLSSIVKTLTKPEAYLAIANTIVAQCRPLYQAQPTDQTNFKLTDVLPEAIGIISSGDPTQRVAAIVDFHDEDEIAKTMNKLATKPPASTPTINHTNATTASRQPTPAPVASEQALIDYIKGVDLLKSRREIMASTVPLRAKILIFSVIYQKFNFDTNDWTTLRQYHLDDLLRELINEFDQLSNLSTHLEIIARCLQEPDEYVQAATVICQALEPIYNRRPPLPARSPSRRIFLNPSSPTATKPYQSLANVSNPSLNPKLHREETLADMTEPIAGKDAVDPSLELTSDLTGLPLPMLAQLEGDDEPTHDLSASTIAPSNLT